MCPVPRSGLAVARAAAMQIFGMLADLKRRAELLMAGWLKNALEDASSGGVGGAVVVMVVCVGGRGRPRGAEGRHGQTGGAGIRQSPTVGQ